MRIDRQCQSIDSMWLMVGTGFLGAGLVGLFWLLGFIVVGQSGGLESTFWDGWWGRFIGRLLVYSIVLGFFVGLFGTPYWFVC